MYILGSKKSDNGGKGVNGENGMVKNRSKAGTSFKGKSLVQ